MLTLGPLCSELLCVNLFSASSSLLSAPPSSRPPFIQMSLFNATNHSGRRTEFQRSLSSHTDVCELVFPYPKLKIFILSRDWTHLRTRRSLRESERVDVAVNLAVALHRVKLYKFQDIYGVFLIVSTII
jgi:hypothetical protein